MSQKLDELILETDVEKKAIRIVKLIEKKFKELNDLGVSAVLNLGDGDGVGLNFIPKKIARVAMDNHHIDTGMGGFEYGYDYDDYIIYDFYAKNMVG